MTTPALFFSRSELTASINRLHQMAEQSGWCWAPLLTKQVPAPLLQSVVLRVTDRASCSSVGDAEFLATLGFRRIILTRRVIDAESLRRLMLAAGQSRIAILIDHFRHAELLSQAATFLGATADVLIEADLGNHSMGVAPGPDTSHLATAAAQLPGLHVAGIFANAHHVFNSDEINSDVSNGSTTDLAAVITIAQHCLRSIQQVGSGCRQIVIQATPTRALQEMLQKNFHNRSITRQSPRPQLHDDDGQPLARQLVPNVPPDISQRGDCEASFIASPFAAFEESIRSSDERGPENSSVGLRSTVISRPALEWCVIDAGRLAFGGSSILRIAEPQGATVLNSTPDTTTLMLQGESRDLRIGDPVRLIMCHPERLLYGGHYPAIVES